jgi:hypothetical protein
MLSLVFLPGWQPLSFVILTMNKSKLVLVSHLENVLQSFAVGGGTGKALVKNLDQSSYVQELGQLYLRLLEDRSSALVLDQAETETLHAILQSLMESFSLIDSKRGARGNALIASVRKYAAEMKDSPVSEAEIALYLRFDAAIKRDAKLAA